LEPATEVCVAGRNPAAREEIINGARAAHDFDCGSQRLNRDENPVIVAGNLSNARVSGWADRKAEST